MQSNGKDLSHLLALLDPKDGPAAAALARALGNHMRDLWDDRTLASPALFFASVFLAPTAVVYNVAHAGGMIAVTGIRTGWRGQLMVALWSRLAIWNARQHDLIRVVLTVAAKAHDLQAIDAFIRPTNRLARASAIRSGFSFGGLIPNSSCYNGHVEPAAWYEIRRADLGLAPVLEGNAWAASSKEPKAPAPA